jgi:tetratricopeptide (TPR) repeat protein
MPEPARRDALEKADFYFDHARSLYPQDIYAAIGHAAVLDELGRPSEALARLHEARRMAPDYGNLLLAEGEHHLRHGRILEAEKVFSAAVNARAFRDTAAAQRGLHTLTEWKLIAEQNGIDWRIDPDPLEVPPLLAGSYESRSPAEAQVAERDLAGRSSRPKTTDPLDPASPLAPTPEPAAVQAPPSIYDFGRSQAP